jgi:hypothetical protein
VATTPEEFIELNHLASKVNALSQKLFEKKTAPAPAPAPVAETAS